MLHKKDKICLLNREKKSLHGNIHSKINELKQVEQQKWLVYFYFAKRSEFMTFKTHEITVDLVDDVSTTVARFSQGDENSAKLILNLTNRGKELDLSQATAVRITFNKPDGTIAFQEDCQPINVMKGKYQIILKTQTLAAAGNVYGQVRIFEGDRKLDAEPFVFAVKQSFSNDAAVESTNEFTIIKKAIDAGEILKDIDIQALIASKKAAEKAGEKADENAVQIGDLQKSLSKQDVKTQLLQHGPNVVNATVASPLNVEVQGRTLVNLLGQTTLDPKKYYLFMPNKGTTKITAGGNSYEGVAKFTGQSAISYTIKQDFRDKVSKSISENGHMQKANVGSTSLLAPSAFTSEETQWRYDRIKTLNVEPNSESAGTKLCIAQILISFDVVRTLQDKFGIQIWQGKTTLADKVAIAKQLIVDYAAVLYANGSSPQGNKLYVKRWIPSTSTWFGSTTITESNLVKVQTGSTNVQEIDSNGFIHVIAYADASDGTKPSVVNVDYAMLELKTKMDNDTQILEDALYEVDQATYNKINVDPEYSGRKLVDKFPYIEGMQHVMPVLTAEGGNLIPPLSNTATSTTSTTSVGSFEVESAYKAIVKATSNYADFKLNPDIPCIGGQFYTFSCLDLKGWFSIRTVDSSGKELSRHDIRTGTNTLKITTPTNAQKFIYWFGNNSYGAGTFYIENPMLVLGDKPKPFTPWNPSYLYMNTVLAGYNGVNDVLYKEDNQWKVLRKWERDVMLDGSLPWVHGANYTDYKRVLWNSGFSSVDKTNLTTKWNGMALKNLDTHNSKADRATINPTGALYISISNTESGWAENYTPIQEEIKGYFNGWKVKTSGANGRPTAWVSLVDGQDAPTQTLAYVKDNKAPNYTPYKLTYQLATPKIEVVKVEGDLVVDGLTQVTVDSGVVVREKVIPQYDSVNSFYDINHERRGTLKNKVLKIISIYRNSVLDTKWEIQKLPFTNGVERAQIFSKDFDLKAEYTVTYLVLDKHQFTTNTTDVKVSYNQSIRSTVDELTVKQSDTITGISILQTLVIDVLARLKANNL